MYNLFSNFGWSNGQRFCFEIGINSLKDLFSGKVSLKKIIATLLVISEIMGMAIFKLPIYPRGEELDLTGYELVVCDEFNGDKVDTDTWFFRSLGSGNSGCGFNCESQAKVEDGNLILTAEYLDAEKGKYGEGWYSAVIALNQWYCKGYFEIRCICNKGEGFWSTFWLQSGHSYDLQSNGGIGGAEIDILENSTFDFPLKKFRNCITQTVYCNGYDDNDENIDKCQVRAAGDDIYNKFNTYGVKWTDDEYIFYINGKETFRTSFGKGVSQVPENLIVGLEIPNILPKDIAANKDYKTQMTVDYVKVYQLAQ
ncbi:MAG: glycoside hydrolase family 16 protein [Clostridiales bacterium]|nr:glycoside hydrolase family 16 protein [Clostridiales bacterium]